jgi:hypothetical protein
LNFWLNFSSSFRDTGFVELIQDTARAKTKLENIIKMIHTFFTDNLGTQEKFSVRISKNIKLYSEVFARIIDFITNLQMNFIAPDDFNEEDFEIFL